MTTGRELDSYTLRFMARPWHETDFYTYCFWWGIWLKKLEKAKIVLPPNLIGRPSTATTNVVWLKSHHNQHRLAKSSTHLRCHLCSSPGQKRGTVGKCARCDVGLCVVPCFT